MKNGFDPEKSLFSLPIVVRIFLTTGFAATILSIIIAFHSTHLPFDLSGDGFSRFVELYKVPISILAIGLTLIGLCGANHRSQQSVRQAKLTASQNIFANHYKQLEEFEKYLTKIHEKYTLIANKNIEHIKIKRSDEKSPFYYVAEHRYRRLYRRIYPKSRDGVLEIDDLFLKSIDLFIEDLHFMVQRLCYSSVSGRMNILDDIHNRIENFENDFDLVNNDMFSEVIYDDPLTRRYQTHYVHGLLLRGIAFVSTINTVLSFDHGYSPSALVRWMEDINMENFPDMPVSEVLIFPSPVYEEMFPIAPPLKATR